MTCKKHTQTITVNLEPSGYNLQQTMKNPLEENSIVGITNYIDFGFELQTSVDDAIATNGISDSTFQIG